MPVTPITPAQIDEVGKGASASQTEPSQVEPLRVSPADAASVSSRGPADLVSYLHRQWGWSKETFGPALRTKGIVQHITKELREIEADPHDLAEWVDVIILAMDGFWRHGGKPEDLLPAMQAKQDKNFARQWPDWRTMGEDQAIEHDRSGETRAPAFAAAKPSVGWRPIETAPKTGQWFEAWFTKIVPDDDADFAVAGVDTIRWSGKGFWWSRHVGTSYPAARPSFWRPLSEPGALAGEAAQAAETEGLGSRASDGEAGTPYPSPPPSPRKGQEENPCPMTVEEAREELAAVDLAFEGLEETDRARRIGHWIGLAAAETTRANAAEAELASLRAKTVGGAGEWRPADTAPTNVAVQVYCPGLDYYGNQGVYAGMLVDMGTGQRWMTFAWAMGRDMCGENRPTHWRPLPAGPESPDEAAHRTLDQNRGGEE